MKYDFLVEKDTYEKICVHVKFSKAELLWDLS